MKHLFNMLIMAFVLLTTNAVAQQAFTAPKGFDVRLGYGVIPVQNIEESFSSELAPALTDAGWIDLKKRGSGVFSASVQYQTKGRLGLGFDVLYSNTSSEFAYSNTSKNKVTSKWLAVMAKGSYMYFRDAVNVPNVALYGAVAIGATFRDATGTVNNVSRSQNMSYFAYQITPLGVRTGQKVGFWAEIGYGFKGLLNAGISVQL